MTDETEALNGSDPADWERRYKAAEALLADALPHLRTLVRVQKAISGAAVDAALVEVGKRILAIVPPGGDDG